MKTKKSKLVVIKTKQNSSSVEDYINSAGSVQKRNDGLKLLELFSGVTKEDPKMWGSSIIGFGKKIYKSPATAREVEWFIIGFSLRKANISIQLAMDIAKHGVLLKKLGKHKLGSGCLYINKLEDIDMKVLKAIIENSLKIKTQ